MSTIREELERMGPERVRRAMVAFVPLSRGDNLCRCFLGYAYKGDVQGDHAREVTFVHAVALGRIHLMDRDASGPTGWPEVERLFEYGGREELHEACIAFLAEHGEAVEPAAVAVEVR